MGADDGAGGGPDDEVGAAEVYAASDQARDEARHPGAPDRAAAAEDEGALGLPGLARPRGCHGAGLFHGMCLRCHATLPRNNGPYWDRRSIRDAAAAILAMQSLSRYARRRMRAGLLPPPGRVAPHLTGSRTAPRQESPQGCRTAGHRDRSTAHRPVRASVPRPLSLLVGARRRDRAPCRPSAPSVAPRCRCAKDIEEI